jgi:asparagine synthase (glutamine-hydrolysing)
LPPATTALGQAIWCPAANRAGLTELDVASGVVVGQDRGPGRPVLRRPGPDPVLRLTELAAELLSTSPCVIAFSGGRDSSALLAFFVDVARRHGLAEPVAVTARWDDDPASDEREWQEQVMGAIGAEHWEFIRPGDDLDLLGAEAVSALEGQGLMWPPPAYAFLPMIRMAAGGVFVSGEGGDEAFGLFPHARFWEALRRRRIPLRPDWVAAVVACNPRAVRRRRWERELPPYQSWLRPDARARFGWLLADDQMDDPLWWDRYQSVNRGRRDVGLTIDTLDALCAGEGARYVGPFLDTSFLAGLATWGGRLGRGDRTAVMTSLFGDLLPGPVLARTTKASFGGVFWGPASRRFAETWDGTGLDERLVDAELLRQEWLSPLPVYGSALPLHAAWLAHHVARADDPDGVTP